MLAKRIVPCLDVRDGRVVKGVNFEGLRDLADPVEMARFYNDSGADELVFYDITASAEGRNLFTDILRRVASEVFIPLTVGGGIRTLEDFDRVLKCGADKVSVNSGAIADPSLIGAAAKKVRRPVRGALHGRQAGGRAASASSPRAAGRIPASTPWSGRSGAWKAAPGRSCSTPSTPTASDAGFDLEMLDALAALVSRAHRGQRRRGEDGGLCGALHPPRHRRGAGGLHLPHPPGRDSRIEAVSV